MTLSVVALTTVPKVYAALGLDDDSDPSLVEDDIEALSALFEQLTGRVLASRTFTAEALDGTGRATLWLTAEGKWAMPVTALTALTLTSADGQQSSVVTVTPSANQVRLHATAGRLTLLASTGGSVFPAGWRNIVATFTAGFSWTAHLPQRRLLERAVILGIQWMQQQMGEGMDIASFRMGDTAISYQRAVHVVGGALSLAQLPGPIQAILTPFIPIRL
jgi:hypothetical protein